jgi:hypothetical protein
MSTRSKHSKLLTPRPHGGQVGDAADAGPITPRLKGDSDDGESDEFAQRFGRGASQALRGARMDDGTGLDPGYQDMVRSNPLHWADPDFSVHHTEQVWNHYTAHQRPSGKDGAKYMDILGLTRLASDTVDRFLQRYRAVMAKTNPKFTPEQVDTAMFTELPHTTIGAGSKDVPTIKVNVLAFLKKDLDKDRDARVGKTDFALQVSEQRSRHCMHA